MASFAEVDDYQMLALANDLFPAFHQGDKRVTLRKGRRDIALDDLVFVSTDPVEVNEDWDIYCNRGGNVYLCQLVNVNEVRYKRLRHITDEEAQADGFGDATALLQGMKRFYPDLELGSEMTFVYFDVR